MVLLGNCSTIVPALFYCGASMHLSWLPAFQQGGRTSLFTELSDSGGFAGLADDCGADTISTKVIDAVTHGEFGTNVALLVEVILLVRVAAKFSEFGQKFPGIPFPSLLRPLPHLRQVIDPGCQALSDVFAQRRQERKCGFPGQP